MRRSRLHFRGEKIYTVCRAGERKVGVGGLNGPSLNFMQVECQGQAAANQTGGPLSGYVILLPLEEQRGSVCFDLLLTRFWSYFECTALFTIKWSFVRESREMRM